MASSGVLAARIAAALIGLVVVFQLAIVLGAPWGEYTQGGSTPGTLPITGRVLAAVSLMLLSVLAFVLLARVGDGPLKTAPSRLVTVLGWVTVGYFGLAIALNLASQSSDERLLWAPIAAVTFVFALMAMIGSRRSTG